MGLAKIRWLSWQEWQGSNLRPPVLETGALPIELHSCREPASPPIRAVSSIYDGPIARAKRLAANCLFKSGVPSRIAPSQTRNGRDHDLANRRQADQHS